MLIFSKQAAIFQSLLLLTRTKLRREHTNFVLIIRLIVRLINLVIFLANLRIKSANIREKQVRSPNILKLRLLNKDTNTFKMGDIVKAVN